MKLVIATTTFFGPYQHVPDPEYRRHLWDLYCDSLDASDLSGHDVTLLVRDDRSPELPRMPKNVTSFLLFQNVEHVGVQRNTVLALNEAKKIAPYCLNVDSDAYFDPNWLQWLSWAIDVVPSARGWCLFNSPWHDKIITGLGSLYAGVFVKDNVQNHGLCYPTANRRLHTEGEWNEAYISELKGYGFILPKISLIQHTGLRGENNVEGVTNDFDPLFPYNDVCGLPAVNPKLEETCNAE